MTKYKTIAVAGLSRDPSKDSYIVAEYLERNGFNIVQINPFVTKSYMRRAIEVLSTCKQIFKNIRAVHL